MTHVHGRPDNEAEHLDDILGRGRGDPDVYGYPGKEALQEPHPKAPAKTKTLMRPKLEHLQKE